MNLLFIQGGSRVRICTNGSYYVDGNFNNDVWDRYNSYCNKLTVILRKINSVFEEENIKQKLNSIDTNILDLKLVDDIYSPKTNFLKFKIRKKIKKIIEEEVKKNDKIIIRSLGNFYTNTALKYCKKYKKDYLIEVTGFAFETLFYHSIYGKIVAFPREIYLKKNIKKAPYCVYVTEEALQKRYPCFNKSLGCSDVELFAVDDKILIEKANSLNQNINNNKLLIGTAAFLDVNFKGQKDVIKAINYLKKQGYNNIFYEMIGAGTGKKLQQLIEKYDLGNNIKIIGALKHNDVQKWMMKLDIYVHSSYMEGLCRSILEAMGLATPVICTDVGGNYELISGEYLYKRKDYKKLAKLILKIKDNDNLLKQSELNYKNSKRYNKNILDKRRNDFYKEFMK